MNFKKMLAMIMALVMVFSLAACSSAGDEQQSQQPSDSQPVNSEQPSEQPSEEQPFDINNFQWNGQKEVWSILPTTTAEGLVWINDSMGAIMEAEGFTYVKKDAQGNPAAQVTFVEDAIANGNVGALMIAAMAVDMLGDVVQEALSKGIAVAYLGAEPTNYKISGCVYTAYEITGQWAVKAAEDWVQKRVAEGGNVPMVDGKYQVACDTYTDIADGIYRSNAIVGTVDSSEILTRVSTTSSYLEGYNKAFNNATDVLNANPDCHIFIAYEPQLALGMDDAIRQHCEMNDLDLADYCVIACYGEDTTFTDAYNTAVADPSASAIKGYSTYGDPAMPYGDDLAAQVGASYEAMAAFSEQLNPGAPVVIPPVLTGEHLADILLDACGIEGYEFEPGHTNTFYDTITVCNVYGYADTWTREMENPAIEYKTGTYIG